VWLYETRGPDIVFKTPNGRRVALEIESGSWLKSDKEGFKKKVKQLNEVYGDDWTFVVTHTDIKRTYARFGNTCTRWGVMDLVTPYFQ